MSPEETSYLEKNPRPLAEVSSIPAAAKTTSAPYQLRNFYIGMVLLAICFAGPLYGLFQFALGSELYSYVILMPAVTLYLIHIKKKVLPSITQPARILAATYLVAGLTVLGGYLYLDERGLVEGAQDELAFLMASFFLMYLAVARFTLGCKTFVALVFPIVILIFMVPMPMADLSLIEKLLQYGSAWQANWMFKLAFTPELLDNLTFRLPGGALTVAPECSGIHSTLILFITSLLAGYLFLRSPWHRAILSVAVLPLALLRNGFRVFTIGELCVQIDWTMADSYIHHHGGPIFFLLSLIPFFALLAWLYRRENPKPKVSTLKT